MSIDLLDETRDQIEKVKFEPTRPLVICDADGVLVEFMAAFEAYLSECGCYFDWSSFKLVGNLRWISDREPIPADDVYQILDSFFSTKTASLDPIPGAESTLRDISSRAQIIVLSNIPAHARAARINCLEGHGMNYPVITNSGNKGPAVKLLNQKTEAPVIFIDDLPKNHASVAYSIPSVTRIYFASNKRLKALLGPSRDSHFSAINWRQTYIILQQWLADSGF